MQAIDFVVLGIIAAVLLAAAVTMVFDFLPEYIDEIREKFFSRKKLKKSRNTESDTTPAVTIAHDLKCPVCGYEFAALADNRYTVDGAHNYGRFNYLRDTTIVSGNAIVDGKHDAFDCPMCGCQMVVHPRLRTVSSPKRTTTTGGATNAPTSEI